jgi:hypothetical protein
MMQTLRANDRHIGESFDTIRYVQTQLDRLSLQRATPMAISRRIELCNVLLREISGIRASLARDIGRSREKEQGSTLRCYN